MNYAVYPGFSIPELDSDELSPSELMRRHLADSRVVKALHNYGTKGLLEMHRPAGADDRTTLPLPGDDATAKKEVAGLLDVLGFDAVDLGTPAESRRSGPNTPLYALASIEQPPPGLTPQEFVAYAQQANAVPVPAARVKELAAGTVRGPAGFHL